MNKTAPHSAMGRASMVDIKSSNTAPIPDYAAPIGSIAIGLRFAQIEP